MKKISFLLVIMFMFAGCAIYRTQEAVIENKSNHIAYLVIREYKSDNARQPQAFIELPPNTSTSYLLYDDGYIYLQKPNRNYLNKNSHTSYEIKNSPPSVFEVFNKCGEQMVLAETNNLFDTTNFNTNENKQITVFTTGDFSPVAKTVTGGITLKINRQANKLIVSF